MDPDLQLRLVVALENISSHLYDISDALKNDSFDRPSVLGCLMDLAEMAQRLRRAKIFDG